MSSTEPTFDDQRELLTGEAVALELRPTSVVLRMAGAIIDYIIYLLVTIGMLWLAFSVDAETGVPEELSAAISIACIVLGLVLLPAIVETAAQGKSLGRLAVGDRIVRDDGGAIAFRHAVIRSFVGVLEIGPDGQAAGQPGTASTSGSRRRGRRPSGFRSSSWNGHPPPTSPGCPPPSRAASRSFCARRPGTCPPPASASPATSPPRRPGTSRRCQREHPCSTPEMTIQRLLRRRPNLENKVSRRRQPGLPAAYHGVSLFPVLLTHVLQVALQMRGASPPLCDLRADRRHG